MSKRLPYFQFEPAEYLAGDIMFCSYGAQGIFNNICALYWQKDCELSYSQTIKRLKNEDLIKELIDEKIIKIEKDKIVINFLNEQYTKATVKSVINSDNGKKGAIKRWRKNSEAIATPLKTDSELDSEIIALREDKIIEDEIKENNTKNDLIFNELIISESWIETVAMNSKLKFSPSQVKNFLKKYNTTINTQFDFKNNKSEYCSHFTRWLDKQEKPNSNNSNDKSVVI